jgi:hypothetical protein
LSKVAKDEIFWVIFVEETREIEFGETFLENVRDDVLVHLQMLYRHETVTVSAFRLMHPQAHKLFWFSEAVW